MSVSHPVTFRSNSFYGLVEQKGPWAPAPADIVRSKEMSTDEFTSIPKDNYSVVASRCASTPKELPRPAKRYRYRDKVLAKLADKVIQNVTPEGYGSYPVYGDFGMVGEPSLNSVGLGPSYSAKLQDLLLSEGSTAAEAASVSDIVMEALTPADFDDIVMDLSSPLESVEDEFEYSPEDSAIRAELMDRLDQLLDRPQNPGTILNEAAKNLVTLYENISAAQSPANAPQKRRASDELTGFAKKVKRTIQPKKRKTKQTMVRRPAFRPQPAPVPEIEISEQKAPTKLPRLFQIDTSVPKVKEPIGVKDFPGDIGIPTAGQKRKRGKDTSPPVKKSRVGRKPSELKIDTSVPKVRGPKATKVPRGDEGIPKRRSSRKKASESEEQTKPKKPRKKPGLKIDTSVPKVRGPKATKAPRGDEGIPTKRSTRKK